MSNPSKLGKPRLLIIGCGDIGLRVLAQLKKRYRIFALTSQVERMPTLRSAGAIPILGNLDDPQSLKRLSHLADTIIHLAPPPKTGKQDARTAALLRCLSQPQPRQRPILTEPNANYKRSSLKKRLIYASTSGVYGDCQGAWVDETRLARPQNARAIRRLDAEQQCRAWAGRGTHHLVILRIPGIYDISRLPRARLRQGTPVLCADDDVYTNHIHADDLARIVKMAIFRGKNMQTMNANDDSSIKMADYFDIVAKWLGLSYSPRLPRVILEKQLPEVNLSFMRESRRLQNKRLKQTLGIRLKYPTVQDFFSNTEPQ